MRKVMMKKKLVFLLLALLTVSGNAMTNELRTFIIQVVPVTNDDDDDGAIQHPHLAPPHHPDLYAVFNPSTGILSLSASPALGIVSISLYKDGTLLGVDTTSNFEDVSYNISSNGSGIYHITLTSDSGDTYESDFVYP